MVFKSCNRAYPLQSQRRIFDSSSTAIAPGIHSADTAAQEVLDSCTAVDKPLHYLATELLHTLQNLQGKRLHVSP